MPLFFTDPWITVSALMSVATAVLFLLVPAGVPRDAAHPTALRIVFWLLAVFFAIRSVQLFAIRVHPNFPALIVLSSGTALLAATLLAGVLIFDTKRRLPPVDPGPTPTPADPSSPGSTGDKPGPGASV